MFIYDKIYSFSDGKTLIVSYHPSRRNTNTGKLTWQMWINIFQTARSIINGEKSEVHDLPVNICESNERQTISRSWMNFHNNKSIRLCDRS